MLQCWPFLFVTNLLQNPVLPDLHFAKEVCRLKNIGEAQTTNRLQNNVSIFLRPLSSLAAAALLSASEQFDIWQMICSLWDSETDSISRE